MNEPEKARFRGAAGRDLSTLVAANRQNPAIAAYPTFIAGTSPGTERIVVIRSRVAELATAIIVGNQGVALTNRSSLQADESDSIPTIFHRALTLNTFNPAQPPMQVPATQIDSAADPGAVVLDAQWTSIPTFTTGTRRVAAQSWTTMQMIQLRRSAARNNRVVSFGVPIGNIPLHAADVTPGRPALRAGDLTDPTQVPVVMRAVHSYAVSKGYAAGVPAFAESAQSLLQIMFIKDAEVVDVAPFTIPGKPIWRCFDLPIQPISGDLFVEFVSPQWALVGRRPELTRLFVGMRGVLRESSDLPLPPSYQTSGTPPTIVDPGGETRPGIPGFIHDYISAASDGTLIHVLYHDGFLMHATFPAAGPGTWSTRVVDGDGNGVGQHMSGEVGGANCLVIRSTPGGQEIRAFYFTPDGLLRQAMFNGTTWFASNLDGHVADAVGRVKSRFSFGLSALAEPDGRVHVFYCDFDANNLRHAENVAGVWRFAVLDGSGSASPPPDGPGTGPIRGWVGRNAAAAFFDGRLFVFYDDYLTRHDNIRMAQRRQSGGTEIWSYRLLDGGRGLGRGRHYDALVRQTTAAVWEDRLSVFYLDVARGRLRHAWLTAGSTSAWNFEVVDGEGGPDGRVRASVGRYPVAFAAGTRGGAPARPLVVAYLKEDGLSLRWAVLDDPL